MKLYKNLALAIVALVAIGALFVVFVGGATAATSPGVSQRHVIGENEIQTRIDQQIDRADADRQSIQILLKRAEVRRIAGSAGLDLERASAAAAVLSGPSLEKLAAQARVVDANLAGGSNTIVISATTVIIILLIIILLAG